MLVDQVHAIRSLGNDIALGKLAHNTQRWETAYLCLCCQLVGNIRQALLRPGTRKGHSLRGRRHAHYLSTFCTTGKCNRTPCGGQATGGGSILGWRRATSSTFPAILGGPPARPRGLRYGGVRGLA